MKIKIPGDALVLYFTGILTIMFLLVGMIYVFQIFKLQSTQDILLKKMDADIHSVAHLFEYIKNSTEQSNATIVDNQQNILKNQDNIKKILQILVQTHPNFTNNTNTNNTTPK